MKTVLLLLALCFATAGCDQPRPTAEAKRPSYLAADGVYFLLNAKYLRPEDAKLKLKSGTQLVHIRENLYQAGAHQVRLAPEHVTQDTRVRQQILADLRAEEQEQFEARVEAERQAASATPSPTSLMQQPYNRKESRRTR
jgi:hypothetical protein